MTGKNTQKKTARNLINQLTSTGSNRMGHLHLGALHRSELELKHASTGTKTMKLLVLETCSCISTKNTQKLHWSKLCSGKSKQGKSWTLPWDPRNNLGQLKKILSNRRKRTQWSWLLAEGAQVLVYLQTKRNCREGNWTELFLKNNPYTKPTQRTRKAWLLITTHSKKD